MSQPQVTRAEHLRRFSDELDDIAQRAEMEGPVAPDEVAAIFAEHEAECSALEAVEREAAAERVRLGRRA